MIIDRSILGPKMRSSNIAFGGRANVGEEMNRRPGIAKRFTLADNSGQALEKSSRSASSKTSFHRYFPSK
jgi:hypothetical protein